MALGDRADLGGGELVGLLGARDAAFGFVRDAALGFARAAAFGFARAAAFGFARAAAGRGLRARLRRRARRRRRPALRARPAPLHSCHRSAATLWMKPCCAHSSPLSRLTAIAPQVAAPCGDFGRGHVGADAARPALLAAEAAPRVVEVAHRRAREVALEPAHAVVRGAGLRHLRARCDVGVEAVVRVAVRRAAAEHELAPRAGGLDRERAGAVGDEVVVARADRAARDHVARRGGRALVQRAPHERRPHHAEGGVGREQVVDRDPDARGVRAGHAEAAGHGEQRRRRPRPATRARTAP